MDALVWARSLKWPAAESFWPTVVEWLANDWARAIALTVIVLITISVISFVYAGSYQGAFIGPIAIRKNVAPRANNAKRTSRAVLSQDSVEMSMSGAACRIKVFYVYNDRNGKTRRRFLHGNSYQIQVQPYALKEDANTVRGAEVPDDVYLQDISFPNFDSADSISSDEIEASPLLAAEYAEKHQVHNLWKRPKYKRISVPDEYLKRIVDQRERYIRKRAFQLRRLREGGFIERWRAKHMAPHRVNVMGYYYMKLEFSHNPFFILARHPDRELKMTAWLTVLTSAFSLLMDAWPKGAAPSLDPPARTQQLRIR